MVAVQLPQRAEAKLKHGQYAPSVAGLIKSALKAYSRGELAESLAAWDQALTLSPENPAIALGRGFALLNLRRFEEVLEEFNKTVELEVPAEFEVELRLARAIALHHLGRSREAVRELDLLGSSDDADIVRVRQAIVDEALANLVAQGMASWSGRRARGSRSPVAITPGPPVSDYVVQDRR